MTFKGFQNRIKDFSGVQRSQRKVWENPSFLTLSCSEQKSKFLKEFFLKPLPSMKEVLSELTRFWWTKHNPNITAVTSKLCPTVTVRTTEVKKWERWNLSQAVQVIYLKYHQSYSVILKQCRLWVWKIKI